MAKRLRRVASLTLSPGGALTGVRDFSFSPANVQMDRTRGDDEAVGDQVDMGSDGYDISFELLATAGIASRLIDTLVVTGNEIERSGAEETATVKTFTFSQGNIEVGADLNTDNPGRITVKGNFKTLAST